MFEAYNEVDQHLHQLSQTVTKVNKAFVPSQADDSHTNLYFDAVSKRIFGRWIQSSQKRIILSINLKSNAFDWLDQSFQLIQKIPFKGKKQTEVEKIIQENLSALDLQEVDLTQSLHYEMPTYPFANEPITPLNLDTLNQWMHFRQFANHASLDLIGLLQTHSEIRIWPHHFDTGVYLEPTEQIALGFGLAMHDEIVGCPYYYLAAYPKTDKIIDYNQYASLTNGAWKETSQWKGAILPFHTLSNFLKKEQPQVIQQFILESTNSYLDC